MGEYLRALAVFCPAILLMGGVLKAQPKTEVIIGVMVMQVVDREATEHQPTPMTSGDVARLLSALITDPETELISRSQLRVSDGMTSMLKIGNHIPYPAWHDQPRADPACSSPLISMRPKYIDTGVNLEITPQVHSSEELTLHVDVDASRVSQYINLGCIEQPVIGQNRNIFDVRLRDRDVTILGKLNSLSTGEASSRLVIALIPKIVHTPGVAR